MIICIFQSEGKNIWDCWDPFTLLIVVFLQAVVFGIISSISLYKRKSRKILNIEIIILSMLFFKASNSFGLFITGLSETPAATAVISAILIFLINAVVIYNTYLTSTRDTFSPSLYLFSFLFLDFFRSCWAAKTVAQEVNFSDKSFWISVSMPLFDFLIILTVAFTPRTQPCNLYENIKSSSSSKKNYDNLNKTWHSSIYSLVTFEWLSNFLFKGFKKPVIFTDLDEITDEFSVKKLWNKFERNLDNFNGEFNKKNLIYLMMKSFGKEFWIATVLTFFHSVLSFVSPQLIGILTGYFDPDSKAGWYEGYLYAVFLFITTTIMTFISNQYLFRAIRVGFRFNIFLMHFMFRRTIELEKRSKGNILKPGTLTNLFGVDSLNFLDIYLYLGLLWVIPFNLILGYFLVYKEIGAGVFFGIGMIILIMIPGNIFVFRKMLSLQKELLLKKDERLSLLGQFLKNPREVKTQAIENNFYKIAFKIRKSELNTLLVIGLLSGINSVLWGGVSIFTTFGIFIYSAFKGIKITPQNAFKTFSLINNIQFPLEMVPVIINHMSMAVCSLTRLVDYNNNIKKYSKSEERKTYFNHKWEFSDDTNSIILNEKNDQNGENSDSKKEKNINSNDFVIVTGKSRLDRKKFIQSLVETFNEKKDGTSIISDGFSYCNDIDWLPHSNIRNIILFGNNYDFERYCKVVEICGITNLIKIFR